MTQRDVQDGLSRWFREQLPDYQDVRIEGLDRVDFGHSAEMIVLTVVSQADGAQHRQEVVVRLRPRPPALLEPYDLKRQFEILRALDAKPGNFAFVGDEVSAVFDWELAGLGDPLTDITCSANYSLG
jgi:aminoglycoside phosphotransferase (APT) family kinase protein